MQQGDLPRDAGDHLGVELPAGAGEDGRPDLDHDAADALDQLLSYGGTGHGSSISNSRFEIESCQLSAVSFQLLLEPAAAQAEIELNAQARVYVQIHPPIRL